MIAISAEFAVLLCARYRAERAARPRARPLRCRAPTSAPAPRCSPPGSTAIAGFAALLVSDFPMLRDFGAVTVVSLTVSLLGVMVVLPAALVWAEQRGPLRVPRTRAELARSRARPG